MQETQVWSLGWRREWLHSSIPAWETHGQRSLAGCGPWGQKWVGHNLVTQQEWKTYVLLKTKRTQKYLTKIYYSKMITFILRWFFFFFNIPLYGKDFCEFLFLLHGGFIASSLIN